MRLLSISLAFRCVTSARRKPGPRFARYLIQAPLRFPGWYRLSFRFPMIHREKSVTAFPALTARARYPSSLISYALLNVMWR